MYNISEEWVALTFMLGLILGIFGVISIVVLVYQNTKFEIMKRKILRRDDEIGMLRKQVENEKRNSGI
ncbi:MAG: hypothetical protein KAI79_20440, partial [Bacteroidales bacterium]|nr:hypothetical protein [Bacteroidales bacterium]